MSSGLFALLDDIAGLANVAAASLDDAASQAAKAGAKAAGIVIDDAAVTPRYAVGFAADRELPIIWRIALGSLKNKLLILLPAALVLTLVAPWAIPPLLMIGGVYLCYEGAEKLIERVLPHAGHGEAAADGEPLDSKALENQKINGAIKTDLILSAEIMAITLASVSEASFGTQAVVMAVVGLGMTAFVYGIVALIVKADDVGVALAKRRLAPVRLLGRGLVVGMPYFLKLLGAVGTIAMLWVGGGIIVHGFAGYGLAGLEHVIHDLATAGGRVVTMFAAAVEWLVTAGLSAMFGLLIGAVAVLAMHFGVAPLLKSIRKSTPKASLDGRPGA